jgi:putative component of toxin-antitoxin plasmid stabilization module
MSTEKRAKGKLVRKVEKLDKTWRGEGKPEGRTASDLGMHLGRAYRAGVGDAARRVQNRNAAARGERSGWEG